MGLLETFRTALESLTANRMRAALTMLGVIIGTMAVVLLLALGEGVTAYFNNQFAIEVQTTAINNIARLFRDGNAFTCHGALIERRLFAIDPTVGRQMLARQDAQLIAANDRPQRYELFTFACHTTHLIGE